MSVCLGVPATSWGQALQLEEYSAPERCPDRVELERRGLGAAESDGRVRVAVGETPGGFQGQLELLPPAGATSSAEGALPWSRTIAGQDCSEVLDALRLSLTLRLEEQRAEAAARAAATQAPPPTDLGAAPAALPSPEASSRWSWGLLGGVSARSGLGPRADVGALLAAHVARDSTALTGSLSVGLELATGAAGDVGAGDAVRWDHDWWAVAAQGCVWSVRALPSVWLEPCAGVHVGRYSATVSDGPLGAAWLGFADGLLAARLAQPGWFARLGLGGHVPLDALGVRRNGNMLFRQGPGWLAQLTLGVEAFSSGAVRP